jgi:hypothetical protein
MERGKFECRICMEKSENPVVTQCGHLFCKECIDRWLNQNNSKVTCPVCKSGVSLERLISINRSTEECEKKQKSEAGVKGNTGINGILNEIRIGFSPDPRDSPNADIMSSFIKIILVFIIGIMIYRILYA